MLLVIGLVARYFASAIYLLKQDYARKIVRERDRAKTEALVGFLLYCGGDSVAAANNKGNMAGTLHGKVIKQLG